MLSIIEDKRINSKNIFVDFTIGEYLNFADDILDNNSYQRKRVRKSNSVYSLLKSDLKVGCVIPPIVLAITEEIPSDKDGILHYIYNNKNKVKILDGLQRTYTIIDAFNELEEEEREVFKNLKVRFEIYSGINKFGILYRMLTLNTGQTPMSTRHQIEILYKDIVGTDFNGMKIVSELDGRTNNPSKEFKFSDLIEGLNSYLKRDELPMNREELLNNIKMLDNLSKEKVEQDVFVDFSTTYFYYFSHVCVQSPINVEEDFDYSPFGKNPIKAFNTSQALTGFGAAAGKMIDFGIVKSFEEIKKDVDKIDIKDDEWFFVLIENLDRIKKESKKIGNSQRMYFHYFFRELFNKDGDSYCNLQKSAENGYQKYRAQV